MASAGKWLLSCSSGFGPAGLCSSPTQLCCAQAHHQSSPPSSGRACSSASRALAAWCAALALPLAGLGCVHTASGCKRCLARPPAVQLKPTVQQARPQSPTTMQGISSGWYGDAPVEEAVAISLVRKACQTAAPCVLSTAHFYGPNGSNETLLGTALAHTDCCRVQCPQCAAVERDAAAAGKALKDIPRSSAVIADKWGVELVEGGPPKVDTSRANGKRILDETLARLGTDYLDVWVRSRT